jgi:lipid-A-disaccharide synthase
MNPSHHLLIVAGEESGDMRASALVRAIRNELPQTTFSGIGGERLQAQGVQLIANITQLAVIGFWEVLKNYPRIKNVFDLTVRHACATRPDAAILVDYPGFNLRLAKILKSHGIKVIYYVSPQIWAWKESRVHLIKKVVDRMIVLFPFEQELYAKHDFKADFSGHPIVDETHPLKSREQFLREKGMDPQRPLIGLVPGSREKEVLRHLPVMLKAAEMIQAAVPGAQILVLKTKTLKIDIFAPLLKKAPARTIMTEEYYDGINACDACIVASGTATLETALMGKPMVVIYKTSWPTYFLARLLVKIPFIALVNIVTGKKIVQELLQRQASPRKISESVLHILKDRALAASMHKDLCSVRARLGGPGASQRAAKVVVEELLMSPSPAKTRP